MATYSTVFVIELHSRRVRVCGATRYPDEAFVRQAMRELTDAVDGVIGPGRIVMCDRDPKWSSAVFLKDEGVRIIRTPAHAPNCNAYAERFVRSIKEACLDRVILIGERHLRRALAEFVAHYHAERNHQGLRNALMEALRCPEASGPVRRRQRLGSMLNYYYCAAQSQRRSGVLGHYESRELLYASRSRQMLPMSCPTPGRTSPARTPAPSNRSCPRNPTAADGCEPE